MREATERRLYWDGCINVRDLGGLPTADGRTTRMKSLVRMDHLGNLSPEGVQSLLDYGVSTVIDLRYPMEVKRYEPHPFGGDTRQEHWPLYVNIPLLDEANLPEEDDLFSKSRDAWHEYLLDRRGASMAAVMRTIADADPGAVVFHCAAGKDRTGIVAALLLDLASVDRAIIADDYALSEVWLQPRANEWLASIEDEAQRALAATRMGTPPEYIQYALSYVSRVHGNVVNYLHAIDLTDAEITSIRKRLVE